MAEVVSVSEPSPLEVVRPGLRELVFSEVDEGWAGTGIAPAMQKNMLSATGCGHCTQTYLSGNFQQYSLEKTKIMNYIESK